MILSSGIRRSYPIKMFRNMERRDRHSKRNRIYGTQVQECDACETGESAWLDRKGANAGVEIWTWRDRTASHGAAYQQHRWVIITAVRPDAAPLQSSEPRYPRFRLSAFGSPKDPPHCRRSVTHLAVGILSGNIDRRVQLPAENRSIEKYVSKKVVHFSNNSRVSKHR